MKNNTPVGWINIKIGEIIFFEYGKGLIKDKRNSTGLIPVYGSNGIVGYHSEYLVNGPCLIVGRKGAIGKVHFSKINCWPIDTTYYIIPPKHINIYFLFFLLANSKLDELDKSTAIPGLNRNDVYNITIPLPPLPEQHRIVAKIEELFTKLDAGVKALKKVNEQVKRYRQAVLKHAFEGKLTEEWRKENKERLEPASVLLEKIKAERKKSQGKKYKELPPVDTKDLPELPEGWVWTRVGNVAEITMGQSPSGNTYNKNGVGLPLINGPTEFGATPFSKTKINQFTSEPKKICKENDLLLCVRGSTTGKMNIAGFEACIGRGVAAIIALFNREYLNYFIHFSQKTIFNLGIGSTFPNITLDTIKEIKFPLSSNLEQQKIVEEIERHFLIAEEIEKEVKNSLKQAERLRKSILKKAFEGKLVLQDPNDEPAEKLLERIRAEKAKKEKEEREKSKK